MLDVRQSQIVELKFFGGFTTDETADVLAILRATVEREWQFAHAWLHDAIARGEQR